MFQLGPHKAPGPNGIPAFFYHEFWSIVKVDVINIVQAFFHSGSLFKPLNHTFIILIPKVTYLEEVKLLGQLVYTMSYVRLFQKLLSID